MFWILFLVFLAACFAPVASGALFKPGDWYNRLSKPGWTPPNWAFPVVWTILYVSMSAAAARVAQLPNSGLAIAIWSVQLTLNTLWSGVFFGLHRMAVAGVIVLLLWFAVASTMIAFWIIDPIACGLIAPYLVWVTLASALNWTVWARNRPA